MTDKKLKYNEDLVRQGIRKSLYQDFPSRCSDRRYDLLKRLKLLKPKFIDGKVLKNTKVDFGILYTSNKKNKGP